MHDPLTALEAAATSAALDQDGYAIIPRLLSPAACAEIVGLYDRPGVSFRSTVVMRGTATARASIAISPDRCPTRCRRCAKASTRCWRGLPIDGRVRLGEDRRWPAEHRALPRSAPPPARPGRRRCCCATGRGDYNRLHQDLYGPLAFPLQVVVLLDRPDEDFSGGELILVEGRARMQSRPILVPLRQGDAAVIPVRERPIASARGWSKATMRHGVAAIHQGIRRTLGIIFHDAHNRRFSPSTRRRPYD